MNRQRNWKGRAAAALVAGTAALVPATSADALVNTTVQVTTTADVSAGPGDTGGCLSGGGCSLRQALAAAELDNAQIMLPAGTYVLEQGELVARRPNRFSPVTRLSGAGAATTTITQDVPGGSRLLHLESGQLEITGVTFTGGSVRGADGADATAGGATADGQPGAAARGGAILAEGSSGLLLYDSVVRGNEAIGGDGGAARAGGEGGAGGDADGGAIAVDTGFGLQAERTVFSGNRAVGGDGGAAGPAAAGGAPGRAGNGGDAHGGAADVSTTASWQSSTVRGNRADGGDAGAQPSGGVATAGEAQGGGIALRGRIANLQDSTVAENVAQGGDGRHGDAAGGGFYAFGTFLIDSSTVAGNLAAGGDGAGAAIGVASGGGIAAVSLNPAKPRTSQLLLSTVARNAARSTGAGGAATGAGGNLHVIVPVAATGSLVAQGQAAAGSGNCSAQPLISRGGNVEDDAAAACGFTAAGDTAGGAALLGPLADNGGPTPTVSLRAGSVAIDAGTCEPLAGRVRQTDQRGAARPVGAGCDAGAYERGADEVDPAVEETPQAGEQASAKRRAAAQPRLRFRLARAATVTVRVQALGAHRGPSGTVRLGKRGRGVQVAKLPARIGGRALVPGRYRATVTARAAGRSRQVLRATVSVPRR